MRVVKYIGTAHRRRITAQNWESIGLTGETVEWSAENGFTVPADKFTEDQLREAIELDRGFVIVGGEDDDVKPRRLPQKMTGQQAHEAPRIDPMRTVTAENASGRD